MMREQGVEPNVDEVLPEAPVDERQNERGVSIVIGSLVLLVLIGMAGFAVDLGWLFLNQTNARKAAESAALAGVVHMPLPASITFAAGTEPWDVAVDVAERSGYTSTEITPAEVVGEPNQLNVRIDTNVDTFFMRVFGINNVDIGASATAEQLPPLKIGSDEAYLGSDPTIPGRYRHFWVSINGEREIKENGDPFSTRCTFSNNCGPTSNDQYKDPAYFYAIEVPDTYVGDDLTFQVYDGGHYRNNRSDFIGGNGLATGDRVNPSNFSLTFQLHEPDVTPGNPQDNPPIGGCSRTYVEQGSTGNTIRQWTSVCTTTADSGIYVVSVSIDGDDRAISDFAFRALIDGNPDNNVAVYGLGAMSVDMVEAAVAPNFKLVRVDEVYAGQQLIISLFDPGDVSGGFADLSFQGSMAGIECEYRVYNHDRTSLIRNWGADDSPGSAPCELDTSGQRFNNQWLEFRFNIPPGYSCPGSCWGTVDYNFEAGASVTERTTWAATINGQPIHLID
ncbi:MAG: pilus assembly protein TadG-related protein [Acidimicrobiia bacterium]|nr:pilus assembly protein TadG-related protein [Acidimicrobiia bacterium]